MKHGVLKESFEGNMAFLIFCYQFVANGYKYLLKLILHGIFELKFPAALFIMNPFIIGQVNGNRFTAGVAIARIENGIIYTQIRI